MSDFDSIPKLNRAEGSLKTIGTTLKHRDIIPFLTMKAKSHPLSVATLAQLFLQLAQLESAGLSPVQALALINTGDKSLQPRLHAMRRQLQAGSNLADAGFNVGIFNDTHKALIHAGESGGTLAAVYRQLADYYQSLDQRLKRIRSRLMLPAAVLCLALLVQPVPALVLGNISSAQYVMQSFGTMLLLVLLGWVVINLTTWLEKIGLKSAWDGLVLQLPMAGRWVIARQLNGFFAMLALLLGAGLPFYEALPRAVATLKNTVLREQFSPALACCHSGISVSAILRLADAIKPSMLQIIANAEQSGTLASTIAHFNAIEAQTLALQDEALAEWLPRLLYALIAAWMAYSILTSGAFMPHAEG